MDCIIRERGDVSSEGQPWAILPAPLAELPYGGRTAPRSRASQCIWLFKSLFVCESTQNHPVKSTKTLFLLSRRLARGDVATAGVKSVRPRQCSSRKMV